MPRTLDIAKIELPLKTVCEFCGNELTEVPRHSAETPQLLSCVYCKQTWRIKLTPSLHHTSEYVDPNDTAVIPGRAS